MPAPKPNARPTQPWYVIRAQGEDTAEVLIYGDIGESWFGESVTAQQFVKDLQAVADKNLVVRINSYGGSVSDGIAIYNAIKRHPKQKDVSIDGVAVSIASLIAMAGDTVSIAENGLLMIHAPWGGVVGNAVEVRKYADVLDKFAEAMATSYAAQTGKPLEEMRALVTDVEDHWYTAQEAADAGFVDEVAPALEDAEAARFQPALFARFKVPAAVAAAFRQPPKETTMPDPKTPATPGAANPNPGAAPAPSPDNVVQIEDAAAARERNRLATRNAAIDKMFAKHQHVAGMPELHRSCLADPDLTIEQASMKLVAKLGEGAEPGPRIVPGADARDKVREAVSAALMHRAGYAPKADIQGNQYRSMTLLDIARDCLARAGVDARGMDKMALVAAAITQSTSDFPVILENTMNKVLLEAYRTALDTWSRFCKTGSVSDFRANPRYRTGSIGNLDKLTDTGEYKHKKIPDGEKGSVTADTKGNLINLSRKAIINDDLGAFLGLAATLGRAAKRTVEADVYVELAKNSGLGPTMSDGYSLFHANHNNISTGAALSADAIDADRVAMASQKDVGSNDYLDLRPAILLLPIGLGGKAREINAQEYNDESNKQQRRPNSVRGLFRDVVDTPRLTGTRRYLFADPNEAPVFEVAFLDGNTEPFLEVQEAWSVDGAQYKVRLDFGIAAIDYRGAVTNAGA